MKKIEKRLTILFTLTLFINLSIDIVNKFNVISWLIDVNTSYIFYVFSALFTVAIFGCTLITISINLFTNDYLGIPIKEILFYKSSDFNMQNIIKVSLLAIIVSVPMLALNLINTLTITLVYIVIYILYKGIILLKYLKDNKKLDHTVQTEIDNILKKPFENANKLVTYMKIWRQKAISVIDINNIEELLIYFSFVKDIKQKIISFDTSNLKPQDKNKKDINIEISVFSKKAFEHLLHKQGFVAAYNLINEYDLWDTEYLKETLSFLRYCNESEMDKQNIKNTIYDIINHDSLDETLKTKIGLYYFNHIYQNNHMDLKYKYEILNSYLSSICSFEYNKKAEYDVINRKLVLYIYRDFVLLSNTTSIASNIFEMIIKELFVQNTYPESKEFFNTISLLFKGHFDFIYYETQTLNDKHRKKLEKLFTREVKSIDNIKISLPVLIRKNIENVIYSLIQNLYAKTDHRFGIFDYFPAGGTGKTSEIWEVTESRFIICLLASYWYRVEFSYIDKFYNDTENPSQIIVSITQAIMSHLNFTTSEIHLSDSAIEEFERIKKFLSETDSYRLQEIYNYFNEKLIEIETNLTTDNYTTPKLEETNKVLSSLLIEDAKNNYNPVLTLENGEIYFFRPLITEEKYVTTKSVARKIKNSISKIIWQTAEKTLSTINISFDIDGVNLLLEKLREDKMVSRNYTYYNDWAFKKEIKEKPEYLQLKQLIENDINYSDIFGMPRTFLNLANFEFNVIVLEHENRQLDEKQIEEWVASHKIADGIYKIDYCTYDFEKAKKYAVSNIIIEYIKIKIKTNLTSDSGFIVTHKIKK